MAQAKIKIVFMGTPEFALPSLENLIKNPDFEVLAVVTQEDKKVGRKQLLTLPVVKKMALEHQLPVLQPGSIKKNAAFIQLLKKLEPDFIVVVAFGKILPLEILEIPRYGCINIHGSLLPKYRGASPVEEALLQGDEETGISIVEMSEKLDSGKIYFLKKILIETTDTALTLRLKLSLLGGASLIPILKDIKEGVLQGIPQREDLASHCHKISKEDGLLNPLTMTAETMMRKIRAYTPWPSCRLKIGNKELKILEAQADTEANSKPGEFTLADKKTLVIGTKKGSLVPKQVQLEGKKPTDIQSFLAGNRTLFNS